MKDDANGEAEPQAKRARSSYKCNMCSSFLSESAIVAGGQLVPKGEGVLWRCFRCEDGRGVNSIVASRESEDGATWFLVRWNECGDWHASWASSDRMASISAIKLRNFEKRNSARGPKKASSADDDDDDEDDEDEVGKPVHPAWTGADRDHLLDLAEHGIDVPEVHRVVAANAEWRLVKWDQRHYNECTWELESNVILVAPDKVADFEARERYGVAAVKHAWADALADHSATDSPLFEAQPSWLVGGVLHEYQLDGINWLRSKWLDRTSVILGDEMGLGKTVQAIGLLGSIVVDHFCGGGDGNNNSTEKAACEEEALASQYKPVLVVAPLSTLENWEREIARWCPMLNVVVLKGNRPARNVVRHRELYAKGRRNQTIQKVHCFLTNYEIAMNESTFLLGFQWSCLVVDEGHRLKSGESSRLFQDLVRLQCVQRVLLTGTPLQNSITELHHLIKFLDHGEYDKLAIPDLDAGVAQTAGDEKLLDELKNLLEGRMLRRLKADVLASSVIPSKRELLVHVELTDYQKVLYKAVLTKNYKALCACDEFSSSSPPSDDANAAVSKELAPSKRRRRNELDDGEGRSSSAPSLDNILMHLRKICNHTLLMAPKMDQFTKFLMAPAYGDVLAGLLAGSGKLALLDKMLTRWKAAGNRVLIFSQFTSMLDVLQEYLEIKRYKFNRIDGSMKGSTRQRNIDEFNKPASPGFVFLLSTRAGGLGINLTSADTVVIFDNDWNPHNDIQALSRAHRIGQNKKVAIYRLVSRATVEERIIEVAKRKRCLARAVVSQHASSSSSQESKITRKQLDDVMRYGAETLFRGQDDKVIKWDDAAVDALLDRDGYGDDDDDQIPEDSPLAELMNSFKVARISFATKTNEQDQSVCIEGGGGEAIEEKESIPTVTDVIDDHSSFRWSELLRESYEEFCESTMELQHMVMRKRRNVSRDGTSTKMAHWRGGANRNGENVEVQEDDDENQLIPMPAPVEPTTTEDRFQEPASRRRLRSETLHNIANKVMIHGLVGAYGGRWEWVHDLLGSTDDVEKTREQCRELLERCLANDRFAIGLDPGRVLGRFAFFVLVEKCLRVVDDTSATNFTSSWTPHHDKRLLAAMCCHGYGCWEELVTLDQFNLLSGLDAMLEARGPQQAMTPDDKKSARILFLKARTRQIEQMLLAADARERLDPDVTTAETSHELHGRLGEWRERLDEMLAEADQIGSVDDVNERLKTAIGTDFDSEYEALVAHERRVTEARQQIVEAETAANGALKLLTQAAVDLSRTPAYRWNLGADAINPIKGAIRHCGEEAKKAEANVVAIGAARARLDNILEESLFPNDDVGNKLKADVKEYSDLWKNRDFRKDDAVIKDRTRLLDKFLETERTKLTMPTSEDSSQVTLPLPTIDGSAVLRTNGSSLSPANTCNFGFIFIEPSSDGLPIGTSACGSSAKAKVSTARPRSTPAVPTPQVTSLPEKLSLPVPRKKSAAPTIRFPPAAVSQEVSSVQPSSTSTCTVPPTTGSSTHQPNSPLVPKSSDPRTLPISYLKPSQKVSTTPASTASATPRPATSELPYPPSAPSVSSAPLPKTSMKVPVISSTASSPTARAAALPLSTSSKPTPRPSREPSKSASAAPSSINSPKPPPSASTLPSPNPPAASPSKSTPKPPSNVPSAPPPKSTPKPAPRPPTAPKMSAPAALSSSSSLKPPPSAHSALAPRMPSAPAQKGTTKPSWSAPAAQPPTSIEQPSLTVSNTSPRGTSVKLSTTVSAPPTSKDSSQPKTVASVVSQPSASAAQTSNATPKLPPSASAAPSPSTSAAQTSKSISKLPPSAAVAPTPSALSAHASKATSKVPLGVPAAPPPQASSKLPLSATVAPAPSTPAAHMSQTTSKLPPSPSVAPAPSSSVAQVSKTSSKLPQNAAAKPPPKASSQPSTIASAAPAPSTAAAQVSETSKLPPGASPAPAPSAPAAHMSQTTSKLPPSTSVSPAPSSSAAQVSKTTLKFPHTAPCAPPLKASSQPSTIAPEAPAPSTAAAQTSKGAPELAPSAPAAPSPSTPAAHMSQTTSKLPPSGSVAPAPSSSTTSKLPQNVSAAPPPKGSPQPSTIAPAAPAPSAVAAHGLETTPKLPPNAPAAPAPSAPAGHMSKTALKLPPSASVAPAPSPSAAHASKAISKLPQNSSSAPPPKASAQPSAIASAALVPSTSASQVSETTPKQATSALAPGTSAAPTSKASSRVPPNASVAPPPKPSSKPSTIAPSTPAPSTSAAPESETTPKLAPAAPASSTPTLPTSKAASKLLPSPPTASAPKSSPKLSTVASAAAAPSTPFAHASETDSKPTAPASPPPKSSSGPSTIASAAPAQSSSAAQVSKVTPIISPSTSIVPTTKASSKSPSIASDAPAQGAAVAQASKSTSKLSPSALAVSSPKASLRSSTVSSAAPAPSLGAAQRSKTSSNLSPSALAAPPPKAPSKPSTVESATSTRSVSSRRPPNVLSLLKASAPPPSSTPSTNRTLSTSTSLPTPRPSSMQASNSASDLLARASSTRNAPKAASRSESSSPASTALSRASSMRNAPKTATKSDALSTRSASAPIGPPLRSSSKGTLSTSTSLPTSRPWSSRSLSTSSAESPSAPSGHSKASDSSSRKANSSTSSKASDSSSRKASSSSSSNKASDSSSLVRPVSASSTGVPESVALSQQTSSTPASRTRERAPSSPSSPEAAPGAASTVALTVASSNGALTKSNGRVLKSPRRKKSNATAGVDVETSPTSLSSSLPPKANAATTTTGFADSRKEGQEEQRENVMFKKEGIPKKAAPSSAYRAPGKKERKVTPAPVGGRVQ